MSNIKLIFKESFALTDIETVAQKLISQLSQYKIICLSGEVGSGKTTLSKSLLKIFGFQ